MIEGFNIKIDVTGKESVSTKMGYLKIHNWRRKEESIWRKLVEFGENMKRVNIWIIWIMGGLEFAKGIESILKETIIELMKSWNRSIYPGTGKSKNIS